jgi:hypothetical protein
LILLAETLVLPVFYLQQSARQSDIWEMTEALSSSDLHPDDRHNEWMPSLLWFGMALASIDIHVTSGSGMERFYNYKGRLAGSAALRCAVSWKLWRNAPGSN